MLQRQLKPIIVRSTVLYCGAVVEKMAGQMKPKVLVTRGDHDKDTINLLAEKCEVEVYPENKAMKRSELLERVKGKDALIILPHDKIDQELVDSAGPQLRVIGTHSVGYEHINLDLMRQRGIKVGYTPDVLTDDVADLSVCLTLMAMRRVKELSRQITDDTWRTANASPFWMVGTRLSSKTVGMMGLGRIGSATAKRIQAFKPGRIIYHTSSEKAEAKSLGYDYVSFDDLCKESDIIIINCAMNSATNQIFNKQAFGKMKKSAFIVNTSRGALINQDDLVHALQKGQIAGAGLDVMTPEPLPHGHILTKMPNVVLTPHIGSSTRETRLDMIRLVVDNVLAGLEGKEMPAPLVK